MEPNPSCESSLETRRSVKRAHRGWHERGYLPHCDYPGLIQSIGLRLFDCVPSPVIQRWIQELAATAERGLRKKLCQQIDRYADMGYGSCFLADARIAKIIEDALLQSDEERYCMLAWCILPNHVHVLAVANDQQSMSSIMQNWKSFTAHAANQKLNRGGEFWFPDYFDEFMRSTSQLEATIAYIENNPVYAKLSAGAAEWQFSSAAPHHRERVRKNRIKFPEVDPQQLPHF